MVLGGGFCSFEVETKKEMVFSFLFLMKLIFDEEEEEAFERD